MKGAGMLVVSLRNVNFGFWSYLGCSGKNATILSCKGLFQGCAQRNIKVYIYIFNSCYLLHSCNQSLKWSLLGVKNRWATPRLVTSMGFLQNFRQASQLPFHVVVPFPPRHGSEITADHGTSTELTEVYPLPGWVNEFL